MVLFYDDVKAKKPLATGWRKYLRRVIKVTLIGGLLAGASLWGLSKAGGNSRALRLGIQDYLTDATGYIAEIDHLAGMKFFPVTHIEFAGLKLYEPVKKDISEEERAAIRARKKEQNFMPQPPGITDYYDTGAVNASIAAVNIQMNFWDMFFSRRLFYVLNIQDIKAEAGIWSPRAFHVQALKLDPLMQPPQITAQGTYGDKKFMLAVQAEQQGRGLYQISNISPFTAALGDVSAAGTIDTTPGQTIRLNVSDLTVGQSHFTGHVIFTARNTHNKIEAVLSTGHSEIKAALEIDQQNITGTMTATALDANDLQSIHQAYHHLLDLWGVSADDRVGFGKYNADIKLSIEKLVQGEGAGSAGHLKAALKMQPYKLQLENILGLVHGGALRGDFVIDASADGNAQLKSDLAWRGWDIAGPAAQPAAQLDSFLQLTAQGKTFSELQQNLQGHFITSGGAGTLNKANALYWGPQALDAMLPQLKADQDVHLQCLIADMSIKGPQATINTLVADFAEMMVMGAGTGDMSARTLNWTLTPKLLAGGPVDQAASLQLNGDIDTPKITAGRLSSLKIAAETAKPRIKADAAWPRGEGGMTSSHPCWDYIEKD